MRDRVRTSLSLLALASLLTLGLPAGPGLAATTASKPTVKAAPAAAATTTTLFGNGALAAGWSDYSWNLCAPTPATLNGASVLLFDECRGAPWSTGGYLHGSAPLALAQSLDFDIWLPTVATAQQVYLAFGGNTTGIALSAALPAPRAAAWNRVHIDLVPLLGGAGFQDLMMMNSAGNPRFYLDNISVTAGGDGPPGATIAIAVDVTANRRPISPAIYGVNGGTTAALAALNAPLVRYGGNAASQYNWQVNATNHAASWYFESIGYDSASPGQFVLDQVAQNKAAGAASMVTIPMLDWVARLGPNRAKLAGYSVAKYGAQQDTDWQWFPDAGNGRRADGSAITNNNPADADTPATPAFHQGLVQLLTQTHGPASAGGVTYYILDNEPGIWHVDQQNVHPQGASLDELLGKIVATATMVKNSDPSALVVGPEEWGWPNYFASGKDSQQGLVWNGPDRAAHGGMDAMPWLLQSLKALQVQTGRQLLDVFSLHYYPQGGAASRNTRSLWDPSYVDESWVNDRIALIPRMKAWVDQYHPGLKLALTEYSWGEEGNMLGATAQADVLGIFGREGLDMATRWVIPGDATPTFKAMQLYRNYDGAKSTFGDVSVKATVPNPDVLSAFAARRSSDGALTLMVVNKDVASHPLDVTVAGFPLRAGPVKRYQLTGSNAIQALANTTHSAGRLADTVPGQSVTLYVFLLDRRS